VENLPLRSPPPAIRLPINFMDFHFTPFRFVHRAEIANFSVICQLLGNVAAKGTDNGKLFRVECLEIDLALAVLLNRGHQIQQPERIDHPGKQQIAIIR